MRLDDGGEEVGRGRAGCADERSRFARASGQAEGEEGGAAFVEEGIDVDFPPMPRQRQYQRRMP